MAAHKLREGLNVITALGHLGRNVLGQFTSSEASLGGAVQHAGIQGPVEVHMQLDLGHSHRRGHFLLPRYACVNANV